MDAVKANQNQLNRRRSFRIYEQVDLVYQKITREQFDEPDLSAGLTLNHLARPVFGEDADLSSIDQWLPYSNAQENDTLNVNISATGISFSCKEALKPGDYLKIRVLLLSSLTWVETCCRVVYCKPGNPFEDDHYPYLVGAQYIKLRPEDKALLSKHVNKKRKQHLFVNGMMISLLLAVVAMPDVAFDLSLTVSAFILENSLAIVDLANDVLSYAMDRAVEAVFHTEARATQIISFYFQLTVELTLFFILFRYALSAVKNLVYTGKVFYFRKKSSFLYYWGQQTLIYKISLIGFLLTVTFCYLMFFI